MRIPDSGSILRAILSLDMQGCRNPGRQLGQPSKGIRMGPCHGLLLDSGGVCSMGPNFGVCYMTSTLTHQPKPTVLQGPRKLCL